MEMLFALIVVVGVIVVCYVFSKSGLAETERLINTVPPVRGELNVRMRSYGSYAFCELRYVDSEGTPQAKGAAVQSFSKHVGMYEGPAKLYFSPENKGMVAAEAQGMTFLLRIEP